jgi:nucleoside-diphosphate-sugar epimerase
MASGQVALIAGATGLIGRRLAEHLKGLGDWEVIGLCRHPPAASPVRLLGVDLTSAADCRAKLAPLNHVTHLFYTARYDHPEGVSESVEINAAMLRNLVDALEPVARGLRHIHLVHGSKYYGHNLGPLPMPMREDNPRAPVANFYFDQEDFVRTRQPGKNWTFSTSRPHMFCDDSWDQPRSVALLIAVYASIQRELGLALGYPGSAKSFHARTQFTALPLLVRAMTWMATDPRCANQSYNVVNGDAWRWSDLWPRIAGYFGMQAGRPESVRLDQYMADKGDLWQAITKKFGLRPSELTSLVLWPYGNYVFSPEWDIISDMSKARRDGFAEAVDSEKMFCRIFERLRAAKIIP